MKFFLLDVYSERNIRVSKDTNGGYGTANDFGRSAVSSVLSKVKKETTDFPPVSLAYIASVLKFKGHQVEYGKNTYPPRDVDTVILQSSIVEFSTELEWGRRLKKDGFHIGYVGPVATILNTEYLNVGDFIIMGEAEFFFLEFTSKELLKGKIKANSHKYVLDDLPFPDWDCFSSLSIKYQLYGGGGQFFPMLASRGCPHSCGYYCTYPVQQGNEMRFRSAGNVVDEMEYLKNKYSARTIMFRDPIFGIDRNRTMQFLDELIKRDLRIKFIVETHLNNLHTDLIPKFKQAGLITVKVGIESPNQDILDKNYRRQIKKDFQQTRIRKLEKAGIMVICFYILAFPQDTWKSCISTIRYAVLLNTTGAQFSICTPYPGTSFYEEMKKKIIAKSFDDFTQFKLVYKHDNLSPEQIEKLKNIAYGGYYLRISWLAKYVKMRFMKK